MQCPPFLSPVLFWNHFTQAFSSFYTQHSALTETFYSLGFSYTISWFLPYCPCCYFGGLLRTGLGSNVPSQSPLLVLFPLHYRIGWKAPEFSLSTVLFSLTPAYFWRPRLVSQFKWLLNLHLKPSPHFWTCISNCLLSISTLLSNRHVEVKSLKGELLPIFLKSARPIIVPVSVTGNTIFPTA